MYRTFHLKTAEYTLFISACGTFCKIGHMLGHKRSLNTFKQSEITLRIFSDHNDMKPEIDYNTNKQKPGKTINTEIKQHATEQPMGQRRNQKKKYI